jgi:putative endonuclease
MTNNLEQRVIEHYLDRVNEKTFTGRYNAFYLVYYECTQYVNNAIAREKEIKGWSRKKKVALIESFNPQWKFLNYELLGEWPTRTLFIEGTDHNQCMMPRYEASMSYMASSVMPFAGRMEFALCSKMTHQRVAKEHFEFRYSNFELIFISNIPA